MDCGLDDRDTPGEWSSIFHVCLYLDGEVASAWRNSFVVWEQQDGNMAVVLDHLWHVVDVTCSFR